MSIKLTSAFSFCHWIVIPVIIIFSCSEKRVDKEMFINEDDLGYSGNLDKWEKFLKCWQSKTLERIYSNKETSSSIDELILSRKKQTYEKAVIQNIIEKEKELGFDLPMSYKDFLLASNGVLLQKIDDIGGQILPVNEIGFFSEKYPKIFKNIRKYLINSRGDEVLDYSENQDPVFFNGKHFDNAVIISDFVNTGAYFINPNQTSPEGELEFWFYSSNNPGVYKFVSFSHLMQYTYVKTIYEPDSDVPYGGGYYINTCAEVLGLPKISLEKGNKGG